MFIPHPLSEEIDEEFELMTMQGNHTIRAKQKYQCNEAPKEYALQQEIPRFNRKYCQSEQIQYQTKEY